MSLLVTHEKAACSPTSAGSPASDPLATVVRAHLAAGRWRKARDEAKFLCKRDRPRYLPLLIEANIGLARDMITRGQVPEAEQVLAYLRSIAPPSALEAVETDLACARGDANVLRDRALLTLSGPGAGRSEAERIQVADQAVLAFEPFNAKQNATPALVAELQAVHQALESLCARRFEEALDRIRPLPRDSVFGHWKLFIKGLTAFYLGDRVKAARCFDELPAGSAPAKVSAGYCLLVADPAVRRKVPGEAELEVACRVLGRPKLAIPLLSAGRCWRKGQYVEAYESLRRAAPDFPSVGTDPLGAVSEFCFNALHSLPTSQSDRIESLFGRLGFERKGRSSNELALALRAMCLHLAGLLEPRLLDLKWREFLALLNKLHGPNPRRDSLGLTWLGEQLAEEAQEDFGPMPFFLGGSRRRSGLRDGRRAVAALKNAAESDQANLDAHLKLCEVYRKLGETSQRNHFLDHMAERFPDRKEVLLLAGTGCLDRNALKKGIEYLERALALDRLDPAIPDALVTGRIRRAVEQYQGGRLEPARQTWAALEEFIVESPDNLTRSRWAVIARQGLLETLFGDAALGQARLDQARDASPSIEAFRLHLHFAQRVYAPKAPARWLEDFAAQLRTDARLGRGTLLMGLLRYWEQLLGENCRQEEEHLRRYLDAATLHPFTRDEAVKVILATPPSLGFDAELGRIVDRGLDQDPNDPFFRLYALTKNPGSSDPARAETFVPELNSIIEESHRRGDDETASAAQSVLNRLNFRAPPLPEGDFNDALFDEDDEDFEPGLLDSPSLPAQLAGDAMFGQLVEMMATATPSEIQEFKRNPPLGMPRELVDTLIQFARDAGGSPLPPLTPPLPKSRPRRNLPDQSELPF